MRRKRLITWGVFLTWSTRTSGVQDTSGHKATRRMVAQLTEEKNSRRETTLGKNRKAIK